MSDLAENLQGGASECAGALGGASGHGPKFVSLFGIFADLDGSLLPLHKVILLLLQVSSVPS